MRTNVNERFSCYLIFNKSGIETIRRGRPHLAAGEHAVKLTLKVPAEVFAADLPEAIISVPLAAVIHPTVEIEPLEHEQETPAESE